MDEILLDETQEEFSIENENLDEEINELDLKDTSLVEENEEADELFESGQKCNFDDILFDRKVGVYVKVDKQGFITDINSDVFISDFDDWQKIDEGVGDKYVYAQTQYFGSLVDEEGDYIYKK